MQDSAAPDVLVGPPVLRQGFHVPDAVAIVNDRSIVQGVDERLAQCAEVLSDALRECAGILRGPPITVSAVVRWQDILDVVSHLYGVSSRDVRGDSLNGQVREARQVAAWVLARWFPAAPLVDVASWLGRKDHSSVTYALRKVKGYRGLKERRRDKVWSTVVGAFGEVMGGGNEEGDQGSEG